MLREPTTSITDFLLAVEAVALAALLAWRTQPFPSKLYWLAGFLLMALAAILGGFAHGLARPRIFPVIFALLAGMVAALSMAVLTDAFGPASLRWALWPVGGAAAVILSVAIMTKAHVRVFVGAGLAGMALLLVLYLGRLAAGDPGAGFLAAGAALSGAAAPLIIKKVGFTAIWKFDHNGLYHLVQMLVLLLFYLGLSQR